MKTNKPTTRQRVYSVVSLVILSAILISTWTSGCNQNPEQTIAFTNVNLVPMTSEMVVENQTVLVRGSKIVAIGASDEVKIPRGSQVIDGQGAYLMPGLADMHAHILVYPLGSGLSPGRIRRSGRFIL
jgi:cytosine/adenosine deaminase-related metal-dependent hydrolase